MHQLIDKKNKIIIYLLFLFILSTTSGKHLENKISYSSKINQINIIGLSNEDNSKILKELRNLLYKNILFVDKEAIQKIILKYNIIDEYNVKKIYPSTIDIRIRPTKFIARLPNNDQLVGENGKIIDDRKNKEILPYIFGEFNSQDFLNFKEDIKKSKFTFSQVKTLYFFPSKRWDILTNNDILIKLPHNHFFDSLNLAYKIINNNDFKNQNLIDLRINNHLIVNNE